MFLLKRFSSLLLILFFYNCNIGLVFKDSPKVENGILNLTFWDFEKQGAVNLEGNWEIYWKKILRPEQSNSIANQTPSAYFEFPSSWRGRLLENEIVDGNGYATFRVKILLPAKVNKQTKKKLAMRMKEQATAYELYLDNELLASKGKVGTSAKESIPGYGTNTFFFETEKETLDLVIIVSNYHHRNGGIWSVPVLGTHEQIQQLKYERNSIEFLLGGSILIMTLYHFMLFLFRKNDHTSLYFALFCLITLMRVISTGEIMLVQLIPNIHYEIVTKFEYFSFFLLAPLFFKFFQELFPNEVSGGLVKLSVSIGGILGMIVCLFNLKIYNYFVDFNYIILILTIILVYYYQIKIIIKRVDDSITVFLCTNFLIIFILNDILYNLKFIITGEFMQIGVFIFLLAQSVILSRRFSSAFRDIEKLSSHLSIVNNAYSNFVPKEFLRLLNKESITDVSLGNLVKKDITILFSGIRGFTSITEKANSEEIFDLLNKYYTGVTSIIRKNNGFIDKFIGDEIVVLFPDSAENAVVAAGEINQYLEAFNHSQSEQGKLSFKIGIGIHSGSVTLGTLGGKERMDTTVIGNAVGIAKKIETLTKSFFVPIIISSDTYALLNKKLKDDSREIEHLHVGGNDGFITIYEYFGSDTPNIFEKKKSISSEYFRALTLYRGGFIEKAKSLFSFCQTLLPDDPIYSLYINRCNDSLLGNKSSNSVFNSDKPLVLIIDISIVFSGELEIILKKENVDTITAYTANDAISICENMKPSLVFINVDASEIDGYRLIATLRKKTNLSKEDCYIVAITKENNATKESLIYKAGADDFILNPIHVDSIKQIINRVVSG
jgi:class 3 adenylate cyclase/CheY-like chemotaxis protein